MRNTVLSLVIIALAFPICSNEGTGEDSPSAKAENDKPVLEYWDGGVFIADVKPFPIVVVWPDGTVVKRVDDRLLMGTISKEAVKTMLKQIRAAGFFTHWRSSLLNTYGMVYPDGPEKCLVASDGATRRILLYHGRDELNRFDQIGSRADPSREECQVFAAIWKRTVAIVREVDPAGMKPFDGRRPIRYPGESQPSAAPDTDRQRR